MVLYRQSFYIFYLCGFLGKSDHLLLLQKTGLQTKMTCSKGTKMRWYHSYPTCDWWNGFSGNIKYQSSSLPAKKFKLPCLLSLYCFHSISLFIMVFFLHTPKCSYPRQWKRLSSNMLIYMKYNVYQDMKDVT